MSIDNVGPWLQAGVAEAKRRLLAEGRSVGESVIRTQPGLEVAWDFDCALLWGRVARIDMVPMTPKADGTPCGIQAWDLTLALGIIRCITGMSEGQRPKPPTPAAISSDGDGMLADIATLRDALTCGAGGIPIPRTMVWQPLGPQGDRAGGEWQYVLRVGGCACAEV